MTNPTLASSETAGWQKERRKAIRDQHYRVENMAKLLGRKFRLGAGLASASFLAGSTVAYCESDKGRPLFDPEALERGAKALKEINASPYAKKVKRLLFKPTSKQIIFAARLTER